MAERHFYEGSPEPGFKEQITEAVEKYLVETKKGPLLQPERLFNDYPDIEQNHDFLTRIYEIATTIYDERSPNR